MAKEGSVQHPELADLGSRVAGLAGGFKDTLASGRRANLPDLNRNAVSITITLDEAKPAEAATALG